MVPKRYRNIQIKFFVTEDECKLIKSRANKWGFRGNVSSYLRKVSIDTHVYNVDLKPLSELALSVDRVGNNINQVAKVANSENHVSKEDIKHLQTELEEIHQLVTEMYDKCLKIKDRDYKKGE